MAMWNWADDSGHGTANLKELEAFVFPNDEVAELPRRSGGSSAASARTWQSFAEVCNEVAEAYGVVFYRVGGRPYYWIPNFKEHQSKNYRASSKYPPVLDGEIYDVTSGKAFVGEVPERVLVAIEMASAGNSAPVARSSEPGGGEQGNRGTGEEGRGMVADATRTAPTCKKHAHWEHDNPCRACANDRKVNEEARAAEKAAIAADARRAARRLPQFCPHGLPAYEACERCGESWPGR